MENKDKHGKKGAVVGRIMGGKDKMMLKLQTMSNGKNIWFWIKILIALFALSANSLVLIEYGYSFDIPVLKWIYAVFKGIDAEGVNSLILLLGIVALFFSVKNNMLQRDKGIIFFSAFLAMCTAIGKSYHDLGNWDYIFRGRIQFTVAVIFVCGHYYVFKNCIIFLTDFVGKHPNLLRKAPKGVERYLFGKYAYIYIVIVLTLLLLPYYIAFLPGTIHADVTTQLYQHFGCMELTGHHPVMVTKLMGICVEVGKGIFHNDTLGVALYMTPQAICQVLIFAYAIWLMCKLDVPMIFRWIALVMYGIFPLFPMYAVTVAKDTGYYECAVLFLVSLIHVCYEKTRFVWWNRLLLVIGSVGLCVFRKEGKYIVIMTLLIAMWQYRNKFRIFLIGIISCILTVFLIEGVYMPLKDIKPGGLEEMLSIPLQQTARYIKENYDAIPEGEIEELQAFFEKDIRLIADTYNPEISDPVKAYAFFSADNGGVFEYFKVWFKGLLRSPDIYIQAFLNQVYGYFYPDRGHFQEIYYFLLVGYDEWETSFMHIHFVRQDANLRNALKEYTDIWGRLPVVKLLYSPGTYVYILFGCFLYLSNIKRFNEICILIPSLLMFLICIVSPVNAYLRYVFPLIALTPINLMWCYIMKENTEEVKKTSSEGKK